MVSAVRSTTLRSHVSGAFTRGRGRYAARERAGDETLWHGSTHDVWVLKGVERINTAVVHQNK